MRTCFVVLSVSLLAGPVYSQTVTSVDLTGPGTIARGASATYSLEVQGTGTAWIAWSIGEAEDNACDTELKKEKWKMTSGPTWTYTFTFDLECTAAGYVKGPNGTSDDASSGVYGLIEDYFGLDLHTIADADLLWIACDPAPSENWRTAATPEASVDSCAGGDCTLCDHPGIPTVSEWGLAALTLLVLSAGTLVLMKRRLATV